MKHVQEWKAIEETLEKRNCLKFRVLGKKQGLHLCEDFIAASNHDELHHGALQPYVKRMNFLDVANWLDKTQKGVCERNNVAATVGFTDQNTQKAKTGDERLPRPQVLANMRKEDVERMCISAEAFYAVFYKAGLDLPDYILDEKSERLQLALELCRKLDTPAHRPDGRPSNIFEMSTFACMLAKGNEKKNMAMTGDGSDLLSVRLVAAHGCGWQKLSNLPVGVCHVPARSVG